MSLPSDLETRIDRRRKRVGFKSVDEYVAFVLEQVLRTVEAQEGDVCQVDPVDTADVREQLRELGYL